MRFLYPWFLWMILLYLPLFWLGRQRYRRCPPALAFPSLRTLPTHAWQGRLWIVQELLLCLTGLCLLLACARPQVLTNSTNRWDRGVDLMIAVDISSSMLRTDFQPNRLALVKRRLVQWLKEKRQQNDNVGLVIFARKAFTLCPLTSDFKMLQEMLRNVEAGVLADDTAIGDALAVAIARLRHRPKAQRAILLFTDGENNSGQVHPIVAAKLARRKKIRIFSLFLSSNPFPSRTRSTDPWRVFQNIAQITRGQSWKIRNAKHILPTLRSVLTQIAPQRRRAPKQKVQTEELFPWFAWPALLFLCTFVLLALGLLKNPLHMP
ncbi:MAG: VWA domain-containing protein [Myxococcota bacterium]